MDFHFFSVSRAQLYNSLCLPLLPRLPGHSWPVHVCVVVTAYDFESGRPSSNPERVPIYYKASITAQDIPEPSFLQDSTLVPE